MRAAYSLQLKAQSNFVLEYYIIYIYVSNDYFLAAVSVAVMNYEIFSIPQEKVHNINN